MLLSIARCLLCVVSYLLLSVLVVRCLLLVVGVSSCVLGCVFIVCCLLIIVCLLVVVCLLLFVVMCCLWLSVV